MNLQRAFWLKQLHTWHWVSAALSLTGMLLFAITGITLNHAGQITAATTRAERQASLPPELHRQLRQWSIDTEDPLPDALTHWTQKTFGINVAGRPTETGPDEIYIDLPMPGGDSALLIERETGTAFYQTTRRGVIAYLNDLHKGRNTGRVWSWFIDILASCCIIFTLTGLALLVLHGRKRPATWPVTSFSLLLPLLVVLLFMHS